MRKMCQKVGARVSWIFTYVCDGILPPRSDSRHDCDREFESIYKKDRLRGRTTSTTFSMSKDVERSEIRDTSTKLFSAEPRCMSDYPTFTHKTVAYRQAGRQCRRREIDRGRRSLAPAVCARVPRAWAARVNFHARTTPIQRCFRRCARGLRRGHDQIGGGGMWPLPCTVFPLHKVAPSVPASPSAPSTARLCATAREPQSPAWKRVCMHPESCPRVASYPLAVVGGGGHP